MKKLLCLVLVALMTLLCFSGCNKSMGFGSMNFQKVHIALGTIDTCVEITSWHDNEIGCELRLKDGSSIYCSEGTYILVDGICPICVK